MGTATQDWQEFTITSAVPGTIPLRQVERNTFELDDVVITYTGETGLEHHVPHNISMLEHELLRTITHHHLPETDLASVPGPMRWFTNSYGSHTPAALIHDYLIVPAGEREIIPATWADRYFRFMLKSCGVPFLKRSIMWTGVALRTRSHSPKLYKKVLLLVWAAIALAGMIAFALTAPSAFFGLGDGLGANNDAFLAMSLFAPVPASALWEEQWLAGVITAVAAPWLLPAAIVAGLAWLIYRALELAGRIATSTFTRPIGWFRYLAAFWKFA